VSTLLQYVMSLAPPYDMAEVTFHYAGPGELVLASYQVRFMVLWNKTKMRDTRSVLRTIAM